MSVSVAPSARVPVGVPSRISVAAVHRLRRALDAVVWARALLLGAAVALVVLIASRLALMAGAPAANLPVLHVAWLAVAAGALAALARRWRDGRVDHVRAALWAEEQEPCDFAIVTALEPQRTEVLSLLERRVSDVPWVSLTAGAARRALLPIGGTVVILAALLVLLPAHSTLLAARAVAAGTRTASEGAREVEPGAGIGTVIVEVRPPAYAQLPARTERDPGSVAALVGSRVRLSGRTTALLRASDGETPLQVSREGDQWSVAMTMPERPVVTRLLVDGADRLVLLTPVIDSTPVVAMAPSVRDTVLPSAAGTFALLAEARDDLGLASGSFEYIVSSGDGESFSFRTGTVGHATLGGAKRATLRATMMLDALQLEPGDIVHVRALASDRNTLTGPGVGSSETRTIRIARLGEYDSLAVEGVPPAAADTAALSQRMLLILTERLEKDRPQIVRDSLLSRAQRISTDQSLLRKRVGELIYVRLGDDVSGEHSHFPGDGHEHGVEGKLDAAGILAQASAATGSGAPESLDFHGGETPVVAINKPLLEAYNHMWDATRALDLGEPSNAIPPMRLALAALQRARLAERIYLRGRPPTVVVDVGRARLQGETHGEGNERSPRQASDPASTERAQRLERALRRLVAGDTAAVLDSLTLLRADALTANPALAVTLGTALDRLRSGQDASGALQRARRQASSARITIGGLQRWGGLP